MQELLPLWSWGASPSLYVDVFTHLEAPGTPCFWDFMEASSRRQDGSLTPFPAPIPPLEDGVEAENPKLLTMAWSF